MTFQQLLVWFLTAVSAVTFFCFLLLVQWYWRREQIERKRLRKARMELAELSILFQSIREVIAENKRTAAAFSKEVETRVDIVKDILLQSVARTRELYERQRKLAERIVLLENKLRDLERIAERYSSVPLHYPFPNVSAEKIKAPQSTPSPAEKDVSPSHPAQVQSVTSVEDSTDRAQASKIGDVSGSGIVSARKAERWMPAEFSTHNGPAELAIENEEKNPEPFSDGQAFPECVYVPPDSERQTGETEKSLDHSNLKSTSNGNEPEGWEKIRQAFQDLLDLAPDEESPSAYPKSDAGNTASDSILPNQPEKETAPENQDGQQRALEVLKRRVAAYRDAGMTEDAIARELGIERGEVRLILGLSRLPREK